MKLYSFDWFLLLLHNLELDHLLLFLLKEATRHMIFIGLLPYGRTVCQVNVILAVRAASADVELSKLNFWEIKLFGCSNLAEAYVFPSHKAPLIFHSVHWGVGHSRISKSLIVADLEVIQGCSVRRMPSLSSHCPSTGHVAVAQIRARHNEWIQFRPKEVRCINERLKFGGLSELFKDLLIVFLFWGKLINPNWILKRFSILLKPLVL